MLDRDVGAVLSFYALAAGAVRSAEPLGNAGGWSGSRLWRVYSTGGPPQRAVSAEPSFCLRRWPAEHPTAERLRLIHSVLAIVGDKMPIVATPLRSDAGATFVEHAGHFWELAKWLPGAAESHAMPSRPRLRAALQTLARFHELASRYQRRTGVAPAVVDRKRRLLGLREKGLSMIEAALASPLGSDIDGRAERLFVLCKDVLRKSSAIEALAGVPELPLQPAIRDIHRDHVLFTGDDVTGLIDFGAMKIDTPLTDVARLVGSLVGDDRAERQFALGAYSEIRPLSEADRRLIDYLDESGLVLGALNWLTWLYVERRDMGPIEPVVRRLDGILRRLEAGAAR